MENTGKRSELAPLLPPQQQEARREVGSAIAGVGTAGGSQPPCNPPSGGAPVIGRASSSGRGGWYSSLAESADKALAKQEYEDTVDTEASCVWCTSGLATALCIVTTPIFCLPLLGSMLTVPPRHAAVTTVFGRFLGSFKQPGLYWVNPCGLSVRMISTMNHGIELQSVKVADGAGNPLVISGVVTYCVVDATRAALDVEHVSQYVQVQAHATLKRVASRYPYVTYDGSPSLKSEAVGLSGDLVQMLQEKVTVCGVRVLSFDLSDLSYASEIAGQMLQRQQAQAVVDARSIIVQGAVGICHETLENLAARGYQLTPAEQARITHNLLTVIASERTAVPTLNLS